MGQGLKQKLITRGEQIFLSPCPLYRYCDIVTGVQVAGKTEPMRAVDCNSFVKYKYQSEGKKILAIYQDYFLENESVVVSELSGCQSAKEINQLADQIRNKIIQAYRKADFRTTVEIEAYNRTRKIIDLYFEHLVAMSTELSQVRNDLVPHLFLPLDSQMFGAGHALQTAPAFKIFDKEELRAAGVTPKSKYGDLKTCTGYLNLQAKLLDKARAISTEVGQTFHRIYFDLLWNDRISRNGGNLFETNP